MPRRRNSIAGVYIASPKPEAKVWGETTKLATDHDCSLHLLTIASGGYCSVHVHDHKRNLFVVLRGRLLVRMFADLSRERRRLERILEPGQVLTVPAGVRHQFEALTDVQCLELYTVKGLNDGDIRRFSEGGLRC